MDIGKTIKVLRTAAGISQKGFAGRLEISPSYLSLIESNEREPSVSLLRQISRLLGVPVSVFFFDNEPSGVELTPLQQEEKKQVQQWMGQILDRLLVLDNGKQS